jgi:hypothetical protein
MNGLYVVAKPRQGNNTNEFGMYVYAWSVQDGRRIALPQSPIRHDVSICLSSRYSLLTHTGSRRPPQGFVHQLRAVQPEDGIYTALAREAGDLPRL